MAMFGVALSMITSICQITDGVGRQKRSDISDELGSFKFLFFLCLVCVLNTISQRVSCTSISFISLGSSYPLYLHITYWHIDLEMVPALSPNLSDFV